MKKIVATICLLCMFVSLSACVNWFPIKFSGIVESEDPHIRILLNLDPHLDINCNAEWIQDDGTVQKMHFGKGQGQFIMYRYREDGFYGIDDDDIIFRGDYRCKEDTLILFLEDGSEITLKKTAEVDEWPYLDDEMPREEIPPQE